ncbi:hypothetical protein F2Q68_00010926 [Brassica cretica]|uniref:Uncharacterized protein n=1 Tax=Brassica cretica TaxID=69181 RepID=A0A3N6TLH7_BRACR|nr:hypothetical protein F2Q68_00010926 [Brassica cretica]
MRAVKAIKPRSDTITFRRPSSEVSRGPKSSAKRETNFKTLATVKSLCPYHLSGSNLHVFLTSQSVEIAKPILSKENRHPVNTFFRLRSHLNQSKRQTTSSDGYLVATVSNSAVLQQRSDAAEPTKNQSW